jgi:acetyltransferase
MLTNEALAIDRGQYPSDGPIHLNREVRLRNGAFVRIRPMRPDDAAREHEFVRGLSRESRYQRFLFALDELTPEMLRQFTRVDYHRDMALVAVLELSRNHTQIGVARYASVHDGASCEFAVAVADHWRGTGLARALMLALIDAARDIHRLPVMEGVTLPNNHRMKGLARSLGFDTERDPRDGSLVRMRRTL